MGVSVRVERRLTEMSAREIDELLRATQERSAPQGLPAPGTADALRRYQQDEPKPEFLPGEMEALLNEVYAARREDCQVP